MNKIISAIINTDSLTVIDSLGVPKTVCRGQANFIQAKKYAIAGDYDSLGKVLDLRGQISKVSKGLLTLENGNAYYRGKPLHGVVSGALLKLLSEGASDGSPIVLMLEKLLQNPDSKAVLGLYDFVTTRGLTIDKSGDIICHKGVREDYYSVMGNTESPITSGVVDNEGHILNSVGATIRMDRAFVESDRNIGCAKGLHLGSWSYSSSWGAKTLLCKFNPKDAVSVPFDCNCQKLRVCEYEVLEEVSRQAFFDVKQGLYGDKQNQLSRTDLVKEIKSIIESQELDIYDETDLTDIPDFLSNSNFDTRDYNEALKMAVAEEDVRERVLNCISRYLARWEEPSVKKVHSNLKIKGLSKERIRALARDFGYEISSTDKILDKE